MHKSCCCCFIPAPPIESSDLVTMMYSLSTYKLFLSQYYLLLTFNKILKLIFHCRNKTQTKAFHSTMSRHFLVLSLVWWVKTMLCRSSARQVHIWNVTVIVVLRDYLFRSLLIRRWRRIPCVPLKWLARTLKSCRRERPYSPISVSTEETFHFPLPVLGSAAEMSQHRSEGQDILYLMCWNLPEVLWRKKNNVLIISLQRKIEALLHFKLFLTIYLLL